MEDKLKSSDVGGESRCRYSLHGLPLAIMIWALEAIPTLGMKFGMKYPDVILRMVTWEMSKRLTSAAIDNVLNSKELEVNSTLIPTEVELKEGYWKELKPIMEEDESVSHHSEGDEAEHDVEPQQRGFEINIADLLRTKMEKLEEGCKQSYRLDLIGTAYAPENEPKDGLEKEVGFDDVIDVHAAERKIDLPEEDSKLKEEDVRGKNVEGNELETEAGFNDVRDVLVAETNLEAREEDPKLEEEVRGKNVGGKDLENEAGSGNEIDEQEKGKMIKESVRKEIILKEQHPDVEKGIADFMMPKKHDVDTNEFTQGM
ncbi:Hypothetical predicted protein [Olea europaea subsp. europaea]|uniref:Uncharacterized protein n=1 Tax=Olea europaea subsp. europaea TaxID=158383 RepID=A0A8S0RSP5_OLEEU|nr:Hypothetical predicted protein [Olea europaea subsp. europaea]